MKLAINNLAAIAALGLISFASAAHAQTTISSGTYTGNPGTNGANGGNGSNGTPGGNGTNGSIGDSGYTVSSGMTLVTGGTFTGGKGGKGGNGGNGGDVTVGEAGIGGDGGNGGNGGYALSVTGTGIVTLDGGSFSGGAGGSFGFFGSGGRGLGAFGRDGNSGREGSNGSAGLPLFVGNGGTLYFGGTKFSLESGLVSGKFSDGTAYSFKYATSGSFKIAAAPAATPEPGSVAFLVGMGITGVGVLRRRRK